MQQQPVTSVSRTARLPLSEIAVAQTVGGALRTARVIIKERQDHLSCFANQRTVTRGEQHVKRGRRARLFRFSRDLGDGFGGDEAELRRAARRGSSSSERAKGGKLRMIGQSLLLGQAALLLGE